MIYCQFCGAVPPGHVCYRSVQASAVGAEHGTLIARLQRAHRLVITDHSNDIEIRQTIDDAIAALSGKGPAT